MVSVETGLGVFSDFESFTHYAAVESLPSEGMAREGRMKGWTTKRGNKD
jgi:hypothetical protein